MLVFQNSSIAVKPLSLPLPLSLKPPSLNSSCTTPQSLIHIVPSSTSRATTSRVHEADQPYLLSSASRTASAPCVEDVHGKHRPEYLSPARWSFSIGDFEERGPEEGAGCEWAIGNSATANQDLSAGCDRVFHHLVAPQHIAFVDQRTHVARRICGGSGLHALQPFRHPLSHPIRDAALALRGAIRSCKIDLQRSSKPFRPSARRLPDRHRRIRSWESCHPVPFETASVWGPCCRDRIGRFRASRKANDPNIFRFHEECRAAPPPVLSLKTLITPLGRSAASEITSLKTQLLWAVLPPVL